MSLQTRLSDLITAVGTDIKQLRVWLTGSASGDLTGLTTTAKTSVVAAVNEINAKPSASTASETVAGVAEFATQAETNTGTDDTRTITPLKLQTRMAAYAQPLDSDLTAIAAVTTTTYGRSLLTPADASATRTLLGLSAVAASGSAADLTGVLPSSALPPLGINETFVVVSQAAMLALTAQRGDVAIRTDTSRTYILSTDSPGTLADWKLVTAAGDIVSVNGFTGVVVLAKADVGLGNVDNTSDANKPISTAETAALALKAPLASPAFTGTPTGITKTHVGLGSVDNTSDAGKPISTATQTALDLKQAADTDLAAIAALVSAADKMAYATGVGTWALTTVTAAARGLLDDADVATMRTTLSVYSQTELGNPETDLAALYATAKA